MQAAWIGEVVDQRIERAGERHEEAGQRERDPDVALDWDAEEAGAALVLADGDQRMAEGRAQDEAHDGDDDGEADQHEIIERPVVVQDVEAQEAELDRLARKAAQAVVAAGERRPLEGDVIEHLAEGDGDHGEIDAAAMHHQRAEQRAGDAAKERSHEQAERRREGEKFERQAAAISAQSEPGGVAEGEHAGEAEQEVDRHGGERQHQHAGAERGIATEERHPEWRQRQQDPHAGDDGETHILAHVIIPSSPRRPRGRISSTSAMITYITASLACGRNTVVMPEATPISSPPSSVPVRLPTPPTMMAMKLGISSPVPMVDSRPSWPEASTPDSPAR